MMNRGRQHGHIDNSIVLPIFVVLVIVAYASYSHTGISGIPIWLWVVAGITVVVFLLLPNESAFSRNFKTSAKPRVESESSDDDNSRGTR